MKFKITLAVAMLALACSGKGGGGTGGGSGGSGGTAGGSATAGGRAGGQGLAGGATAGGTATAGGSGTAGGTATAGGSGTAGGTATAGGAGTAGGTATAGGSGTGGGSGMLCGGLPCVNGCCGGNFCLGYGGQTAAQCGDMGNACAACPMGQTCSMGRCVQPNPPPKQIGDPCLNDNECAILGTNFRCKTMTSSGNASYPGGYCTKICTMDTECTSPTDAGFVNNGWCIGLNPAYGESDRFCWRRCAGTFGSCRTPDYACYNLGSTPTGTPVTACWLAQIPAVDAGPPSDKIGNPCQTNAQCSNPPDPAYGVCLLEFFINADGGSTSRPTGYTGGYCSANCNVTQAVCGADGICLSNFISSAGNGIDGCARRCPSAWAGQDTCRSQYVCEGFVFLLADGGTTPAPPDAGGFCSPSCFADGGECGGQDAGFYCDAGYCTR